MTKYKLLLILFGFYYTGSCQEIPKTNSSINRTDVYFEEQLIKDASEYELEIYLDSSNFEKVFIQQIAKIPAFWVNGLNWGATYYWQVKAYDKNHQQLSNTERHKFNIVKIEYQGYEKVRMVVKTNKEDLNCKGLICVDYTRCIFDRKGTAIWTLPLIKDIVSENMQIRDLKVTKDNTITFLTLFQACEIDLEGNILWRAPYPFVLNSDTVTYHHDFKKTNRGTYMVLGNKTVDRKILGTYSDSLVKIEPGVKKINGQLYKSVIMAVLLEFDKNGKLIWYWDATDYVTDEDMNYKKGPNDFPTFLTHSNAFGENEAGTKVYVGFRNLSRIVKIDKRTKKVELTYGERYPSGDAVYANKLFKNQHDANVTNHNSIYILNNNGTTPGGISSVLELRDNIKNKKDTVCLWKFDLDFDTLSVGKSVSGGKVDELPNSNLLVCGGELNRIFEVTKEKEIVWDAFMQGIVKTDSVWQRMPQYRASWVKQLKEFHFIPQIIFTDEKRGKADISLIIYNTGNSEDAYEIEVFSENRISLSQKKTDTILKGESSVVLLRSVPLKDILSKSYIIVTSRNGHFSRKILVK